MLFVSVPRMAWILVLLLIGIIQFENTVTETIFQTETITIVPSTRSLAKENNKTSNRPFNVPIVEGYCSSPDVGKGTFVEIGGMNATENSTYVNGTVATYKCINLHDRLNNATSAKGQRLLRFCDATTRKWSGQTPICEATCQPVGLNDEIAYLYNISYDTSPLFSGRHATGTKASLTCNFTITFQDSINGTSIVCQPNGTWAGSFPTCSFHKESATIRLTLFATGVIVVCALALLIFIVGCFVIYQRVNKRNPIMRKNADNEAQRTTIPYGGFYSFQETPQSDEDRAEYATIHRLGTRRNSRNHSFVPMSVTYNKIK